MKRTSKFIIVAATAAITFGSLVAFVGPKDWNYHHGHYHGWHHHDDYHQHDHDDQKTLSEEEGNSI